MNRYLKHNHNNFGFIKKLLETSYTITNRVYNDTSKYLQHEVPRKYHIR